MNIEANNSIHTLTLTKKYLHIHLYYLYRHSLVYIQCQ